jgi:hypothetical protein
MIIRIRTVYGDRLWIDSENLARARRRGRPRIGSGAPGSALLRGPRINSGRGLALGHRAGARPQMDHPPRQDDVRDGAPAA